MSLTSLIQAIDDQDFERFTGLMGELGQDPSEIQTIDRLIEYATGKGYKTLPEDLRMSKLLMLINANDPDKFDNELAKISQAANKSLECAYFAIGTGNLTMLKHIHGKHGSGLGASLEKLANYGVFATSTPEIIEYLVNAGESIDLSIMLMMAVSTGNLGIAESLIDSGIELPERTESEFGGGQDMLELLLAKYPKLPKALSENYPKVVHVLCEDEQNADLLERLFNKGVHASTYDLVNAGLKVQKAVMGRIVRVVSHLHEPCFV
jgi:hypothetical protein